MASISSYVLRLSLQHRALYCYLMLSLWILVLLGGNFNFNYSLEGVLVLIRHGDRGPLTHVHNISTVNCAGIYEPLYAAFENYIVNISGTSTMSQVIGTFHGIPILPSSECGLGLLTKVGASQLLTTGKLLRDIYYQDLRINGTALREDVKVFSTRYRRTFQSGLAFLFTFLQKDLFPKVSVQESPSLAFCFDDCACPAADLYLKRSREDRDLLMKSRPAVLSMVRNTSPIVYEVPDKKVSSDPHALKDALLTYVCHNARFPCLADPKTVPESCVRHDRVVALFNYLDWEAQQMRENLNLKKACFLRAYGLLKNIVSHLIRIVSERKPKVVLYSGHDKTLSYLATALGIKSGEVLSPFYSSRLIIEMYKTHDQSPDGGPVGSNYFFRIVFNGKDVTRELKFCRNVDNNYWEPYSRRNNASKKFYLCPIESIVRFLHEDYFSIFNATNIKDACTMPS
ncbi:unnamed protein product [Nesidiocoris tenuis]|uniref:2-phosphoxylose phosphatase 1 n=1 Tax=Nesidiocoris tenuis TaxID=355587 RepID=A0A6H5G7Z0_9HEMI|nr:unnamed protein product [Nesidiocoris tenuis]